MNSIEDIRDIFRVLHDATITSWTGDRTCLTLTIECKYLAERIDKSFENFFLELKNVTELSLTTWPYPVELPVSKLTDPNEIFQGILEMNTAELVNEHIEIICFQHDDKFSYSGGDLILSCSEANIFDHNKNELTLQRMRTVAEEYWSHFGRNKTTA